MVDFSGTERQSLKDEDGILLVDHHRRDTCTFSFIAWFFSKEIGHLYKWIFGQRNLPKYAKRRVDGVHCLR